MFFIFSDMNENYIKELSKVSDAVAEDLELRRLEALIPDADEDEVDYDYLRRRRAMSSKTCEVIL